MLMGGVAAEPIMHSSMINLTMITLPSSRKDRGRTVNHRVPRNLAMSMAMAPLRPPNQLHIRILNAADLIRGPDEAKLFRVVARSQVSVVVVVWVIRTVVGEDRRAAVSEAEVEELMRLQWLHKYATNASVMTSR